MLVTQDGTRFCTGTMINNTRKDRRQLFLTANHCMFMSSTNFVAIFNYQHSGCGESVTEPSVVQSAHGMDLLARWAPSDFALLVIREKIPANYDVYLSGWDISRVAPSNVFGIHHPSGDVKKFSSYNGTCVLASWTEVPNQYHWKVPAWTRGTTEPGSSGSALFNDKGLVVGQLHGGQASCSNTDGYDVYGGLTFSYTTGILRSRRLKEHINPLNLNIRALGGMPLNPAQKDHSITIPMEFLAEHEVEP